MMIILMILYHQIVMSDNTFKKGHNIFTNWCMRGDLFSLSNAKDSLSLSDVHHTDDRGFTGLMWAVKKRHHHLIAYLFEQGYITNEVFYHRTNKDHDVLDLLKKYGNEKCISILLQSCVGKISLTIKLAEVYWSNKQWHLIDTSKLSDHEKINYSIILYQESKIISDNLSMDDLDQYTDEQLTELLLWSCIRSEESIYVPILTQRPHIVSLKYGYLLNGVQNKDHQLILLILETGLFDVDKCPWFVMACINYDLDELFELIDLIMPYCKKITDKFDDQSWMEACPTDMIYDIADHPIANKISFKHVYGIERLIEANEVSTLEKLLDDELIEITPNMIFHAILMERKDIVDLFLSYSPDLNQSFRESTMLVHVMKLSYTYSKLLFDHGAKLIESDMSEYLKIAKWKNWSSEQIKSLSLEVSE